MMDEIREEIEKQLKYFDDKTAEWERTEEDLAEIEQASGTYYAQGNKHAYRDAADRLRRLLNHYNQSRALLRRGSLPRREHVGGIEI